MTDEELEAIEIDWTQGVAENCERVLSAARAALEAANKLTNEAEARNRFYAARHSQMVDDVLISKAAQAKCTDISARVDELEDKIDGLESELSSAVDVLFRRGDDEAREWVRMNYPKQYDVLKKEPVNDAN